MREKDKWADKLQHKMDNYAAPIPDDMWKRIEHDMPATRIVPMWRRVWSYAAAVAVLVVLSLSVWYWNVAPHSQIAEQQKVHHDVHNAVDQRMQPVISHVAHSADDAQLAVAPKSDAQPDAQLALAHVQSVAAPVPASCSAQISHVENDIMVVSVDEGLETEECEAETITQHSTTEAVSDAEIRASRQSRIVSDREMMVRNAARIGKQKRSPYNGRWGIGLSAGNIPYSSTRFNTGMRSLSPHVAFKYAEDANSILRGVAGHKAFDYFPTEVKHRMPIVAGVYFRYNFTSRWGIESGLFYTLLSSDWTSSDGVNVFQKLHYIGVPIKASYNIYNSRFFTFYASAGGMMEKCVYAGLGRRNSRRADSSIESLSEKPFQWSVLASLGAQFNVVRQFGLFVEPGVTYYFSDNSIYETIRKEYPCNFSLNLGLRVSFGH